MLGIAALSPTYALLAGDFARLDQAATDNPAALPFLAGFTTICTFCPKATRQRIIFSSEIPRKWPRGIADTFGCGMPNSLAA